MSLSNEIKAAIGGDGKSRHQTRCLYEQWAARVGELEAALDELHPYDVPELVAVPIERGSAAYLGWVDDNVG